LTVCRYVERNTVRANMVESARLWPYGSLAARAQKDAPAWLLPQARWPVDVRSDWPRWVDRPQTAAEEAALRESVKRGRPFGDDGWTKRTTKKLGLESTLRPRGRQQVRPIKDSRPL
jgi:putative transposase